MADGLEVVGATTLRRVPFGVVALVGEPMAFIVAEAVLGDEIPTDTTTVRFNTGHEARLLEWPCSCHGTTCGPDEVMQVKDTRLLVLPAGTVFDELTPVDLP